jgi:LacI family transcriptional regulator
VATPRGQRATLKDVAETARVSTATASRVLAGLGAVAEEKRQAVLAAAATLNYQPNLQARALRQQATNTVGLILPNLLNAYYTALADEISQILARRGYHLLLSPTRDDPAIESDTILDMIGQNVTGLLLVPSATRPELLAQLEARGVPAVAVVRRVTANVIDTVVFEDHAGAYAATRHLLSLGHRSIAFVGGDVHFSSNHARWQGYLSAMRDYGAEANGELVRLSSLNPTWGTVATLDLLRTPSPPTAIFVGSNVLMPGVIRALQAQRIAAPGDVSLLCFDDVEWFSLTTPTITAVSTSHARLASAAVTLLLNRIESPDQRGLPPVLMEISFELVVRGSTGEPSSREARRAPNGLGRK